MIFVETYRRRFFKGGGICSGFNYYFFANFIKNLTFYPTLKKFCIIVPETGACFHFKVLSYMAFFQPPPIAKEHVDDESDSESEGEAEEIEGGESEDRKPLLAKRVRKVENNREM